MALRICQQRSFTYESLEPKGKFCGDAQPETLNHPKPTTGALVMACTILGFLSIIIASFTPEPYYPAVPKSRAPCCGHQAYKIMDDALGGIVYGSCRSLEPQLTPDKESPPVYAAESLQKTRLALKLRFNSVENCFYAPWIPVEHPVKQRKTSPPKLILGLWVPRIHCLGIVIRVWWGWGFRAFKVLVYGSGFCWGSIL